MFNDPQNVTVDTVAKPLPRVSVGNMTSTYRSSDGSLELNIAHSANKRERSVVRLTANKVGADPFDSTRSRAYTAQTYLVIDTPLNGAGFTDAELEDHVTALLDFLKGAGNLVKILGKES
jgi:hypothetical protein